MSYLSRADAEKLPHRELVDRFIETQTMAAAAISVAIQNGGVDAERAITASYEERLSAESPPWPGAGLDERDYSAETP